MLSNHTVGFQRPDNSNLANLTPGLYYTCMFVNFDESDGHEVPWGILTGLPHHYFPHETRLPF